MAFGGSYFGGLDVYALTRLRPRNSENTSVNFTKMYDSCKFNPAKVLAYSIIIWEMCVCLEGEGMFTGVKGSKGGERDEGGERLMRERGRGVGLWSSKEKGEGGRMGGYEGGDHGVRDMERGVEGC